MKGERTLEDKPLRYGGIFHDYSKTAEYFQTKPECFCCGGDLCKCAPYIGVFKFTKGKNKGFFKFRLLCRTCAYDYGRGVVEMDGEEYLNPLDYKGGLFAPEKENDDG